MNTFSSESFTARPTSLATSSFMNLVCSCLARFVLIFIFLTAPLSGCTTFDGLKRIRHLPKAAETINYDPKNPDVFYDQSVRAYRRMSKHQQNGQQQLEAVVRDTLGKKIRQEEELLALSDTGLSRTFGPSRTAVMGGGLLLGVGIFVAQIILFFPCALGLGVVGEVLGIPALPVSSHLETVYLEEAQQAYDRGREQLAAGSPESALASWDHAEQLIPSLQALSDMNYWRGQAFDSLNEPRPALLAYSTFLDYSESSLPSYFKANFADDPTWERKADHAESRMADLSRRLARNGALVTFSSEQPEERP
ncbi:MAG: hypothetical protein R3B37_18045 [Nitrospira sp.]|nr:hypothetical protein [Nitrospira sp.]